MVVSNNGFYDDVTVIRTRIRSWLSICTVTHARQGGGGELDKEMTVLQALLIEITAATPT